MKEMKIGSLILVLMLFVAGCMMSKGNVAEPKPQITCPVMGGKINEGVYADYEDKRVYFCCGGCISKFQKDPAKYVKKLEAEGVALEDASQAVNKSGSSQGTNEGGDKSRTSGGCGGCKGSCGGGCSH
jgi:YHS domain-containing protein